MKKKEVIQLINDYWKFDNDQDNLSTWHDKQDLISEIEKLTLTDVSQQRELLDAFCCTMEFDVKHETYEEDINYFLENVKADNCG